MESKHCYVCGKEPLTKDEIGITRKLIDKKFPEGASEDDIRALLYKYGYSEA